MKIGRYPGRTRLSRPGSSGSRANGFAPIPNSSPPIEFATNPVAYCVTTAAFSGPYFQTGPSDPDGEVVSGRGEMQCVALDPVELFGACVAIAMEESLAVDFDIAGAQQLFGQLR